MLVRKFSRVGSVGRSSSVINGSYCLQRCDNRERFQNPKQKHFGASKIIPTKFQVSILPRFNRLVLWCVYGNVLHDGKALDDNKRERFLSVDFVQSVCAVLFVSNIS